MSVPRDIRIICFDLGGVVIRICRSWTEGCAAAGIEPRHDQNTFAHCIDDWRALVTAHQTGRIEFRQYTERVSALIDNHYSADEIATIHRAWLIREYDGIADLIDELHTAGLETACLSNTNAEHWRQMRDNPAFSKLRHRHASFELGLHKPDPAIYRAFEQHTGLAGRQIVFFDDLQDNIHAARAHDWHAALIDPARDTAPQIRAALGDLNILSPTGA